MSKYLIAAAEAWDFAVENPIFLCIVAVLYFYVGLEVSGYGIVSQNLGKRRVQKLNDDLVRVRELQQQLGVLRTVRDKRQSRISEQSATEEEEQPKRETKVRFGKPRNLDYSARISTTTTTAASTPLVSDPNEVVSSRSSDTSSCCDPSDFDEMGVASHAYEAIKDTWTWGRHETPLSPVLGWAEGLTSVTIGLFGTDLKGIDDGLKPQVAGLDEQIVKPTISNVLKIFEDLKGDREMEKVE